MRARRATASPSSATGSCSRRPRGVETTLRGGDSFGEIALLRDVPRTATVTALVDSRLEALQREDFLAVVTGHESARAAGDAVAAERLARRGVARVVAALSVGGG